MRILRRILHADRTGKVHRLHIEQIEDDEAGNIVEEHITSVHVCEACGRPIEALGDIRGVCVHCGRTCCVTCQETCAICRRPSCGECRSGFPEQGISVCEDCLQGLEDRMARQDQLLDEKIAFERRLSVISAELKLLQLLGHYSDPVADVIAHIAQIRLCRKLKKLEDQHAREETRDLRRLP